MLAALGWQVFPLHSPKGDACDCAKGDQCESPAKHPRTRNGLKDASSDPAVIERWFTTWPHANIGIVTGKVSGIVVVDVDPRHGGAETWDALIAEHGTVPAGPACATGGGGWHFYYRHPGHHVPSRAGILGAGIDVKGDGGYVVAPPSVHITGLMYEWFAASTTAVAVPAMPGWVHELAIAKQDRRYDVSGGPDQPIAEGSRNQYLFTLGCAMRSKGHSQRGIHAALLVENDERCQPPLEATEVAQIAASAARYEISEAIPILSAATERTASGERLTRAPGAAPKHIEPRTVTLAELQTKVFPPRKMAIPGLMPVGLCLLAGRLKLGKSWMMMGVGIAVSEGGIALGDIPVEEGDVLYVGYEDDEPRFQGRVGTLLGDKPWPSRMEIAPTGCWPKRDDGGLEAVDAWLGQHPNARVVVVDTLQRFRGVGGIGKEDRNAYAADYQLSGELQELALKHDVVIVAVHHYRKSLSEVDWVDQISGTNGIAGAADTLMGFERQRGEKVAVLKVTGRDIEEQEYALAFDAAKYGWIITGTAEEVQLSEAAREFTDAIRELGHGEPVHYKRIAEHLDKKFSATKVMAKRLKDKGEIISFGAGLYGAVTKVTVDTTSNLAAESNQPVTDVTGADAVTGGYSPVTPPDVTGFESENGSGHSGHNISAIDEWLGNKAMSREGAGPCGVCGKEEWLRRAAGGFVCGVCKPWETKV